MLVPAAVVVVVVRVVVVVVVVPGPTGLIKRGAKPIYVDIAFLNLRPTTDSLYRLVPWMLEPAPSSRPISTPVADDDKLLPADVNGTEAEVAAPPTAPTPPADDEDANNTCARFFVVADDIFFFFVLAFVVLAGPFDEDVDDAAE